MGTQRLLAKLTRPRLHGAIPRRRLFETLDAAQAQRSAICVVGPPGAGKTTLVASWLDAAGAQGIWYQIDAGDSDLATFFHHLGMAASPYARKGQRPLPALTPEYFHDIEGFSRRFFRELFARLPENAILVLDNYQEVAPDQALHGLIARAVDEIPPGMLLVAISRRDPPATYARLIANEHVELIDWDQLKLTLDEARAIVGARLELPDTEVAMLHEQSGGWAAGLTLMLEGQRRQGVDFSLPAGREAIFDYFAAQIFDGVDLPTQRFLVTTALLPQVPVSIARELTGNSEAGAILEDLYRRHLFTHRRQGAELAYWYHALFRTFLIARADRVLGTAQTHELQSRAARLLEAGGAFDGAFDLFRNAADWAAASRLIERCARNLLAQGRGQTLREWIQALPESVTDANAWLRYWLGTSLAPIDQPHARQHLIIAYGQFEASGDLSGQALAAAGLIDTYLFEWCDFRPMKHWVLALDQLLERLRMGDNPALEQQIYSSMVPGMLYVVPGHRRLRQCVERLTEMLDEQLSPHSKLRAATMLLAYCNLAADMDRATLAAGKGQALVDSPEVTPFARLWWCLRLGHYYAIVGRYQDSMAALDKAGEIAGGNGFDYLSTISSLLLSYRSIAAVSMGDARTTRQVCERMIANGTGVRPLPRWHAIEARVYQACTAGNLPALVDLGAACIETARETGMIYLESLGRAYLAIGFAATGQRELLAILLAEQRGLVRDTCLSHFACQAALVEAWDELVHNGREPGRARLEAALRFARESRYHYVNVFRVISMFRELLAEAFDAGIETEYAAEIVRKLGVAPPSRASDRWPWPIKVYTFGRFEVHVDGTALAFSGKAPRKPLLLLKAIIALGESGVPPATLIDALWPEEDGDAARKSLDVTISRLRKLLGRSESVIVSDETVTLNPKLVWTDARNFCEVADEPSDFLDCMESSRAALALYSGTFLATDMEIALTFTRREQLRSRFVRLVESVGQELEAAGRWNEAITHYHAGLEADDLAEVFHQGLMRCYRALGRHAEAMSAYRRLRQTLSVTLGIAPSQQSQAIAYAMQQESQRSDTSG